MKLLVLLFLAVFSGFEVYAQNPEAEDTIKNKEDIIDIPDELPEYPGGNKAMYQFLEDHMKYPKKARKNKIQGIVYLQFVIDKDGTVSNVEVIRGIGYGCDEEAVKALKKMPKWKPGKQKGKFVSVRYRVPITFRLAEEEK